MRGARIYPGLNFPNNLQCPFGALCFFLNFCGTHSRVDFTEKNNYLKTLAGIKLYLMNRIGFPFGPHAELVLKRRYLAQDGEGRPTETPEGMLSRVARAIAAAEEAWEGRPAAERLGREFFRLMADGLFLPNSPTLMNAGRPLGQLSACFVLPVEDSLESIFEAVKETALIHQSGGGTGFSFSRLRPAGDSVGSTGGVSSGPVSFMQVFDVATEAIKQGGTRRGANMGMLAVSHPDIGLFITAKTSLDKLRNFNLSVMVDDAFMEAVQAGQGWALINPRDGRVVRRVEAAGLFARIVKAAHAAGEPGLAFFNAINRANPTPALGVMEATNPCGEQPLYPHESCNLGSLVLPRFVKAGRVDFAALEEAAALAVRFLDDAIEVNRFPLPAVAKATRLTRKVGLPKDLPHRLRRGLCGQVHGFGDGIVRVGLKGGLHGQVPGRGYFMGGGEQAGVGRGNPRHLGGPAGLGQYLPIGRGVQAKHRQPL